MISSICFRLVSDCGKIFSLNVNKKQRDGWITYLIKRKLNASTNTPILLHTNPIRSDGDDDDDYLSIQQYIPDCWKSYAIFRLQSTCNERCRIVTVFSRASMMSTTFFVSTQMQFIQKISNSCCRSK